MKSNVQNRAPPTLLPVLPPRVTLLSQTKACRPSHAAYKITYGVEEMTLVHNLRITYILVRKIRREREHERNMRKLPAPVAALSKEIMALLRSNTGIVGSNPTQSIDVCPHLCCVVLCM
jgi:hypothetical protein